jgi:hypothetical protein
MFKYTKLFLMTFAMTFVINVSYVEGWSGNGPNPNAVWFTTQPPAALADVPSATLIPVTTGLRYGKTYFLNIYVDFDAGGNTFWYINSSGVAVECNPVVGCASAILTVYASSFLVCADIDLLSSGAIWPSKISSMSIAAGHGVDAIRCSDSDTCEGKVDAMGPIIFSEAFGSQCKGNFMEGAWGSTMKQLVSPFFLEYYPGGAGDPDQWTADATIGFRVTGTRSEPPQR